MHHNARIFCIISGLMLMLLSCNGSGKSNNNGSQGSNIAVADSAEQGKDPLAHLIHNGTSDTIYEVVTQVYAARQDGDTIIKDGKPSFDREFSAFPNEDTCIYDTSGRIDSVRGTADGIHYKYVYGYDGKKLSDERYYQNGELFYDRRYIYNRDVRVNTIEELYIGGSKTINEYPIDLSKVRYKDGNRIEFGETPNDYTITDSRGNVIKESSYSEMDDYSSVIEYTYNDRGWRISINCEGEYLYTYDYTNIDTHGNWTKAVIRCNGAPYGIVERSITYY